MTTRLGNRLVTLIVIGTLLLVSLSASTLYAEDTGQKVASVDIRGNKRIEDQAIRGRLTSKLEIRIRSTRFELRSE